MKLIELKTISATCPDSLNRDQATKIYRKAIGLANEIVGYYNTLHTQGTRMSEETKWKVDCLRAIGYAVAQKAGIPSENSQEAIASLLNREDSIAIHAGKAVQGQTLCGLLSSHESGVGDIGFELANVGVFFKEVAVTA